MNHEQLKQALEEILKSGVCAKSDVSKQLLVYLFEATLSKKDIKEFTIASELFKKNETDAGVRSYIHNLRKKLEDYYQKEGIHSKVRFNIPKGQYYLVFNENKPEKSSSRKQKAKFIKINLLILGAVLLILAGYGLYQRSLQLSNTHVWSEILESDHNRLVVIGDYFFFGGSFKNGTPGILRNPNINNISEFENFKQKYDSPQDSLRKLNYSYTTKIGIQDLFSLMPHFKNRDRLRICFSSEITFEDLKSENIIFMGNYKTVGLISKLVYGKYYRFDHASSMLDYITNDTIIKRELNLGIIDKEDYSIVIKLITPYKKSLFMIISGDDPGGIATLNYFLDIDNVKEFEKKLSLGDNDGFTAFFKTTAFGRTDISIDIIAANKIRQAHK